MAKRRRKKKRTKFSIAKVLAERITRYGPQPPVYSIGTAISPLYWDRDNNVLAWIEFKKLGSLERNIIVKFPAKSTSTQHRNWISKINKAYKRKSDKKPHGSITNLSKTLERRDEFIRLRFAWLRKQSTALLNRLLPNTEQGRIYKGDDIKKSEKIKFIIEQDLKKIPWKEVYKGKKNLTKIGDYLLNKIIYSKK